MNFFEIVHMVMVCSISGKVDNSVKQMGRLLSEIKGGGQGQAISKSGEACAQTCLFKDDYSSIFCVDYTYVQVCPIQNMFLFARICF